MKKHVFIEKVFAYIAIAASTITLFSCSDNLFEPENDNQPQNDQFFVFESSTDKNSTRVTYTAEDYTQSTFVDGDVVRVYQLSGTAGTHVVKSAPYKVASNSNGTKYLTPSDENNKISQHNGTTYAFVYPDPGQDADISNLSHTVNTNQNQKESFEASDLLWDVVTASNNKASIVMDHAMAQIIVETDEKVAGEDATLTLTGNPAVAISKMNLTYGKEDNKWCESVSTTSNSESITMWNYDYNSDRNRIFRAVVPAQTMAAAKFLTIGSKSYKLNEALTVSGGNNYILIINKNSNPDQPDINDDDSWVLDVVDPETGEPVGLLCREYLRYQPETINSNEWDKNTGTDNGNGSKWINSQAWVFYNLQDFNTRIPNLNTGTVLRFIFDFQKPGYCWWPLNEGYNFKQHGIFAPVHGANWTSEKTGGEYGANAQLCGHEVYGADDKPLITEYYMHGGIVTWDGTNNKIKSFTLPENKITCAVAEKYGHIAIDDTDKNNIKVYVSYNETEPAGIKKGILIPHNLIDKRGSEINKYPLVKIGYNQFWMSKSLNAKTMTDGTPLKCYNLKNQAGTSIPDKEVLTEAGYLYPYEKNVDDGENGKKDYDPYNNTTELNGVGGFKPTPLYNKLCVISDKFLPSSTNDDGRVEYFMPTSSMLGSMASYFYSDFCARLRSRNISTKDYNVNTSGNYTYSIYQSMLRGEERGGDQGAYTANVSGFNWRALGYFEPYQKYINLTATCNIILKPVEDKGLAYFQSNAYTAWGGSAHDIYEHSDFNGWLFYPTQYFGQVRFVMKFKNQADTGGSSRVATRAEATSFVAPQSSNNVYIQLKEE